MTKGLPPIPIRSTSLPSRLCPPNGSLPTIPTSAWATKGLSSPSPSGTMLLQCGPNSNSSSAVSNLLSKQPQASASSAVWSCFPTTSTKSIGNSWVASPPTSRPITLAKATPDHTTALLRRRSRVPRPSSTPMHSIGQPQP